MSPERRLTELLPAVAVVFGEWLRRCSARGVSVLVYETYRSPERQAQLYAIGRSVPGKIVTNARPGQSLHQARRAIDAAPLSGGIYGGDHKQIDWNPFEAGKLDPAWAVMVEEAKALDIEWAGDWKGFREYVHFQIPAHDTVNMDARA